MGLDCSGSLTPHSWGIGYLWFESNANIANNSHKSGKIRKKI